MLYNVIHYTGCVLANTRPHQLCWGDRKMGIAISCKNDIASWGYMKQLFFSLSKITAAVSNYYYRKITLKQGQLTKCQLVNSMWIVRLVVVQVLLFALVQAAIQLAHSNSWSEQNKWCYTSAYLNNHPTLVCKSLTFQLLWVPTGLLQLK